MEITQRLCCRGFDDLEWMYLVNETLEGEKCIVPLLRGIASHPIVTGCLAEKVNRQIDEEVDHVRLFYKLVGAQRVQGSGFREELTSYVNSLECVTLKLFALQGMLEGIALGALHFRIENIQNSPSDQIDKQALIDEEGHVSFSFDHFDQLVNSEGLVSKARFKAVSKDISGIFATHFNGAAISNIFLKSFDLELDPSAVEESAAMRIFRSQSSRAVITNRNSFIERYFDGRKQCSV
jgi:hypothetical protein